MRGTWQTTSSGGWVVPIAVVAVVVVLSSGAAAAMSEFVVVLLAVAGGVVALVLAAGAWLLVRMHRRGAFAPVISYQPQPQELATAERCEAVAAPQELHIHLHGSETEQARQIAAIRQAGYQAWEQREHNEEAKKR